MDNLEQKYPDLNGEVNWYTSLHNISPTMGMLELKLRVISGKMTCLGNDLGHLKPTSQSFDLNFKYATKLELSRGRKI